MDTTSTPFIVIMLIAVMIIGIVLGGAIIFFFRRMAVNRLLRVTQRKTNRTIIESREEAKKIVEQSRVEAENYKGRRIGCSPKPKTLSASWKESGNVKEL
jgi:hypothetical protein